MKVFIINARQLMIGAAVLFAVLIAGIVLLLREPLDSSSSSLSEPTSATSASEPADQPMGFDLPKLAMDVTMQDSDKADVKLITENFEFVGDGKDEMNGIVHGKGHAHIYLDGKMIAQVFDSEFILSKLPKGEHDLRVELAYGNHTPYHVEASQKLVVK
ncbi:hypothetical protein ACTID9_13845 [Brevibacillus fluminis]|uniref:hypothetical protein n=1 Tax=Brevibacillus fluminis TaxID=511487 RepID=UPI003F8A2B00